MKRLVLFVMLSVFSVVLFAQKTNYQTVTIQTNGVCNTCKTKIMESLPYEKGVKDCNYDVKTSKVTVTYDKNKTNPALLRQAISKIGYNADDVKADPSARAKLPACCREAKPASNGCSHSCGHSCSHSGNGEHKCNH